MLMQAGRAGELLSDKLTSASWDPSTTDRDVWQITGWVMVGLSAAVLVMTLLMARRIKARARAGRGCAWQCGGTW